MVVWGKCRVRTVGVPSLVIVVQQAVSNKAALSVQGVARPADEDLTFGAHLPRVRLPQRTNLLLWHLQLLGLFSLQSPFLIFKE